MTQPSEKPFGFEYEHEGKRYAAHLLAGTREEAERRLSAMASAKLIGELRADPGFPNEGI